MSWTLVPLAEATSQPWRNGGGVTRELLAWPAAQDWSVRLSVADIASDGPFSAFPGVQRWFAVLEGEGVWLDVEGAGRRLDIHSPPLEFSGEAPVAARLVQGATRDFNLMVRGAAGSMRRLCGSHRLQPATGSFVAVYSHAAPARLAGLHLPPATLAWCLHEGGELAVVVEDALWMEVTR